VVVNRPTDEVRRLMNQLDLNVVPSAVLSQQRQLAAQQNVGPLNHPSPAKASGTSYCVYNYGTRSIRDCVKGRQMGNYIDSFARET